MFSHSLCIIDANFNCRAGRAWVVTRELWESNEPICGRQQGIVNQIFGVPCKQCDKSENHKAPGNLREEERTYRDRKEAEAGNAHADKEGAMRQDASDAYDY